MDWRIVSSGNSRKKKLFFCGAKDHKSNRFRAADDLHSPMGFFLFVFLQKNVN